jgi:hypothetical protein
VSSVTIRLLALGALTAVGCFSPNALGQAPSPATTSTDSATRKQEPIEEITVLGRRALNRRLLREGTYQEAVDATKSKKTKD